MGDLVHVFTFVSEVVHVYTCLHVLREAKCEYQASSSICLPSCMCMRACLCVHTYMHTSPAFLPCVLRQSLSVGHPTAVTVLMVRLWVCELGTGCSALTFVACVYILC